jgi:hypothetical protein
MTLNRKPIDISIAIAQTVTEYPEGVHKECINQILEIARRKLESNNYCLGVDTKI